MKTSVFDVSIVDAVALHYRQGSSDKVYQARIAPAGGGLFTVEFAYGRRGSTLKTGTKTQDPVTREQARAVFEKLVRQKLAKGYTRGEDGTPYAGTQRQGRATGVACQLLNPVDEAGLERCLASPRFVLQEKFDGRRMLVRREGATITGINRRGLETALPERIVHAALMATPGRWLIDGEAVGDTLHAFDLLELAGRDVRCLAYKTRLKKLEALLPERGAGPIRVVETVRGHAAKEAMLQRLREENREGAVLKSLDAPYTGGRPASGGSQLKFKFHETASCVVAHRNAKRSVSLLLHDWRGEPVSCGNVTVPPNQSVPEPGEVVEIRYLYAFRESGALFQPVFLGGRSDIPADECTIDQLKFKAA